MVRTYFYSQRRVLTLSITSGIFLVTFGMCMHALYESKVSGSIRRYLTTLLLFLFATLDVAFGLRLVINAFIYYKGPGGAIQELSDISNWVNAMKGVSYSCQTSIADAILVCDVLTSG